MPFITGIKGLIYNARAGYGLNKKALTMVLLRTSVRGYEMHKQLGGY
jgi:hypothetical protein